MNLQHLDRLCLQKFWRPGRWNLRPHRFDYGHAFYYEELFCRTREDEDAVLERCKRDRATRVLDLAGGAGRISAALAAQGFPVMLVDKSQVMLSRAAQKRDLLPETARERFILEKQDVAQLNLTGEFSHIFAVNNGFEHLKDDGEVRALLSKARSLLADNGLLVVDVHNPGFWRTLPLWAQGRWIFADKLALHERAAFLWMRTEEKRATHEVVWEHAILFRSLMYRHLKTVIRFFDQEGWETFFRETGWAVEDRWGGWRGEPVTASSQKLIFFLRKAS